MFTSYQNLATIIVLEAMNLNIMRKIMNMNQLLYLTLKSTFLVLCLSLFVSCMTNRDGDGPIVKIYVSNPEKEGLVRSQENEIIKYSDSAGYRCLNKEDFDKLINYCFNPKPDNQFEQARRSIKNLPIKYQDKAIKNTAHNFTETSINFKQSKKD
jgi:hypothetical protein